LEVGLNTTDEQRLKAKKLRQKLKRPAKPKSDKNYEYALPKTATNTLDLMRANTSDKLEHMHPYGPCRKCGKKNWFKDLPPLVWSCLGCGNLLYIELGRPMQQIDIIMKSHRGKEYKHTDRGTIIPV
jgi:ribosomal protein L37AE/L43A